MPILRLQSGIMNIQGELELAKLTVAYDTLILASSPIAYYKMDDLSGATMTDSSGNGNDGTYNSVTYSATRVVEDGGLAITLAGSAGSYCDVLVPMLDLGTNGSFPDPKSIECWFRTVDTVGPLIVGRGPTGTPIIGMYMGNNGVTNDPGKILCTVRDNLSGGLTEIKSPLAYNDGNPHHVVWVFDGVVGKTWRIYVDGSEVVNGTFNLTNVSINTNDQEIGRDPISVGGSPHFSFAGEVDNVAVYSTALSAPTVLAHYNAGL